MSRESSAARYVGGEGRGRSRERGTVREGREARGVWYNRSKEECSTVHQWSVARLERGAARAWRYVGGVRRGKSGGWGAMGAWQDKPGESDRLFYLSYITLSCHFLLQPNFSCHAQGHGMKIFFMLA